MQVKRLLKSDCLKVGNIPADTSNDTLRLLFESKKRTDGGQVTKISRTKDHVLIYFALFEGLWFKILIRLLKISKNPVSAIPAYTTVIFGNLKLHWNLIIFIRCEENLWQIQTTNSWTHPHRGKSTNSSDVFSLFSKRPFWGWTGINGLS